MSATAVRPQYTPEDLLSMPDGERYELVNGNLVERDMGAESSWIGGETYRLLANFVREHGLGWVFNPECGYQCFLHPRDVRRPDASFIARGRLESEAFPKGHVQIPPDLAVEVVSPNDLFYEVEEKIGEYLDAGVRLVWVVNPQERTVQVFRPDGSNTRLLENDELAGEEVIPGFRCRVAELFPPVQAAPGQ